MQDWRTLSPVFICLADMGIRFHLCQDLIRNCSHYRRVWTHDAKRNGPRRIGAEDKSVCAKARFRSEPRRYLLTKAKNEFISLLGARRQDDHLSEVRNR